MSPRFITDLPAAQALRRVADFADSFDSAEGVRLTGMEIAQHLSLVLAARLHCDHYAAALRENLEEQGYILQVSHAPSSTRTC